MLHHFKGQQCPFLFLWFTKWPGYEAAFQFTDCVREVDRMPGKKQGPGNWIMNLVPFWLLNWSMIIAYSPQARTWCKRMCYGSFPGVVERKEGAVLCLHYTFFDIKWDYLWKILSFEYWNSIQTLRDNFQFLVLLSHQEITSYPN